MILLRLVLESCSEWDTDDCRQSRRLLTAGSGVRVPSPEPEERDSDTLDTIETVPAQAGAGLGGRWRVEA